MNLPPRSKSANWKYTALSVGDVSPEIAESNTGETSSLLQNMENDGLAICTPTGECTSPSITQTSFVKIHKKTKVDSDKSLKANTTDRSDNLSTGNGKESPNNTADGSAIAKCKTEQKDDVAEISGVRPKTDSGGNNVKPAQVNSDAVADLEIDITRKFSDTTLSDNAIAWQAIGPYGTLKTKQCQRLYAKTGRSDDLALFHINGRFYAMEAWCTHMGGPLFDGDIENYNGRCHVMCPWHSYMFDLDTGNNEIGLKQKVYKMKYENGFVYVRYHSELTTEPDKFRKLSKTTEQKNETDKRKTSVLESPFKL